MSCVPSSPLLSFPTIQWPSWKDILGADRLYLCSHCWSLGHLKLAFHWGWWCYSGCFFPCWLGWIFPTSHCRYLPWLRLLAPSLTHHWSTSVHFPSFQFPFRLCNRPSWQMSVLKDRTRECLNRGCLLQESQGRAGAHQLAILPPDGFHILLLPPPH